MYNLSIFLGYAGWWSSRKGIIFEDCLYHIETWLSALDGEDSP